MVARIVRAMGPESEQMVVTAAGITHFGTLAAGEFLTGRPPINPQGAMPEPKTGRWMHFAPNGWERKNIAIVLSTEVIRGSPGPPQIVAADIW
jgi:hypothetical protein